MDVPVELTRLQTPVCRAWLLSPRTFHTNILGSYIIGTMWTHERWGRDGQTSVRLPPSAHQPKMSNENFEAADVIKFWSSTTSKLAITKHFKILKLLLFLFVQVLLSSLMLINLNDAICYSYSYSYKLQLHELCMCRMNRSNLAVSFRRTSKLTHLLVYELP